MSAPHASSDSDSWPLRVPDRTRRVPTVPGDCVKQSISGLLRPCPCRILPFSLCRQSSSHPLAVDPRVIPAYSGHWQAAIRSIRCSVHRAPHPKSAGNRNIGQGPFVAIALTVAIRASHSKTSKPQNPIVTLSAPEFMDFGSVASVIRSPLWLRKCAITESLHEPVKPPGTTLVPSPTPAHG